MISLKPGVSLKNVQPQMAIAIAVAEGVYRKYQRDLVITAVSDGTHMKGSLHYKGLGMDLRTSNLTVDLIPIVLGELKKNLGEEFDVIFEKDHIHVEFDPKSKPLVDPKTGLSNV